MGCGRERSESNRKGKSSANRDILLLGRPNEYVFFFFKENGNGDIKVKRDRYNERKETTSTSLKGSFTEWGTKCLGKERKCK